MKQLDEMVRCSFANIKGGVGKTSSCAHLGAVLAQLGYRVLLIDMDKRAALSMYFDFEGTGYTTSDVLTGAAGLEEAAKLVRERLYLIPATSDIERTELELASGHGGEIRMSRAFREFDGIVDGERIDVVLFDTAGDWNIVTRNALMASTHYIVPINSEPWALTLAVQTIVAAQDLTAIYGHKLDLLGVLLTRFRGTKQAKAIEASAMNRWPNELLTTRIRQAERINELAITQQTTSDVKSSGAVGEDYTCLAREFISRV